MRLPPPARLLILLCILLAGCQADRTSKNWAASALPRTEGVDIVPRVLELRYAENRAIGFSLLRGIPEGTRRPLIFALSGTALMALLILTWRKRGEGFLRLLPLALILGGAFGNLFDRVRYGYVVDFVHVHWEDAWSFPIFNVADSLISVGMMVWLAQMLWGEERGVAAE